MIIKDYDLPIMELKTRYKEHLTIKGKDQRHTDPITNGLQGSLASIFVFE